MLVTLSFQVLPRMRQCCYCASCCYSGNAAVAVPFALAPARMQRISEKSAREHSLNRHTRVRVCECVRAPVWVKRNLNILAVSRQCCRATRFDQWTPPLCASWHALWQPCCFCPHHIQTHTHTNSASEQRGTHTLIRIHLPPPHCSLQCQSIPSITMPSALRCLPVRASK